MVAIAVEQSEIRQERLVILASSLGTVFEWYDFYLVGSLAAFIGKSMFSGVNPTAAFIFALLSFAAGFAVRPFGAIFFGRLGDMAGRKYTFLITILIMGLATVAIGLLPGYARIGLAAPIAFVGLRMFQGLALGGEYGGAATYVAEHAPNRERGDHTAWIQITAALGLFLALMMILAVRTTTGEEAFADWGWRVPFVLSLALLVVSVWIRMRLNESPVFERMKKEGRQSKAPLTEALGTWKNIRLILVATFGLTAGQAVVWYTGHFYALFFLNQTLKLDGATANILLVTALLITTPLYLFFGRLSDRIGRKPILLAGFLLAVLTFFPLFKTLAGYINPDLEAAQDRAPIVVTADPGTCSFQFNPLGISQFTSPCDIVKSALSKAGLSYDTRAASPGEGATVSIGDIVVNASDPSTPNVAIPQRDFDSMLAKALAQRGYPDHPDPAKVNKPMTVLILVILMTYGVMTYAPLAAVLVEMFPARIRYTSMSLPYNIGNGWFGGFLPASVFAIVAARGNIYAGLWYPIIIAAVASVIAALFLPETRNLDINRND